MVKAKWKVDKSGWGPGPWQDEPDNVFWMDRGYACEIKRSPSIGHLCGYVEVKPGHPWHGKGCDDIEASVHGGLTYADGTDHLNWRIGFDCAHLYDLCPGYDRKHLEGGIVYRDIDFVRTEIRRLVDQAVEAAR